MDRHNSKLATLMIVSTIFGLLSGVVGAMFARAYLWGQAFSIPLFGEIYIDQNFPARSGAIISGARKVVVEQDTMALDTANSVRQSIVGFFPKKTTVQPAATGTGATAAFDPSAAYGLKDEAGQGFILTSDGWIVSTFAPLELDEYLKAATGTARTKALRKLSDRYAVVASDKRIFKIDNVVSDKESGFIFWHVVAADLSVRRLARDQEITSGQAAIAANWDGLNQLSAVAGLVPPETKAYRQSDRYAANILLSEPLLDGLKGGYLFSLSGDLIGLVDKDGTIRSMGSIFNCIECLLKDKQVKRPVLGLTYLNLEEFAGQDDGYAKGALIAADGKNPAVAKGAPADKAGLKAGDILLTVNNSEISPKNDLNRLISQFAPGTEIEISFLRAEKRETVRVVLGAR